MPATFVQVAGGNGSNSVSVAFGSNNTSGNFLVALVGMFCGSGFSGVSSFSDTRGNSWITATSGNDGVSESIFAYYVPSCAGGANTVSITASNVNTTFTEIYLYEFSGTSGALDVSNIAFNTTNNTPSVSATTTVADVVFSYILGGDVTGGTTGWTQSTVSSTNIAEYLITSVGGAQTASYTQNRNGWMCIITSVAVGGVLRVTLPKGNINVTNPVFNARQQAWAVRQSKVTQPGNVLTSGASFPSNVVAGNLLIIAALDNAGNAVQSITDSLGTTYFQAVTETMGASAYLFYGNAPAAGANSVFITWGLTPNNPVVYTYEIIGACITFPLDVAVGATGTGTSLSSGLTGTLKTGPYSGNDFLFGFLWAISGITSLESGWTQYIDFPSNTATESNTPFVAGSYAATGTSTPNAGLNWISLLATFLPSAGGNGPLRPGPIGGVQKIITSGRTNPGFNFLRVPFHVFINPLVGANVTNHTPINPVPPHAFVNTSGIVHGTLRIADQIFVTGALASKTVLRNPINTLNVSNVHSKALNFELIGTTRIQLLNNNINVTIPVFNARLNPLEITLPKGNINLSPVVLNVRYGSLRVTLTPAVPAVVITGHVPASPLQIFRPIILGQQPNFVRTFMGANGRLMSNLGPLSKGSVISSSKPLPTNPMGFFPHAKGTITIPQVVLNPGYGGALRQSIKGFVNTSSPIFNVRYGGFIRPMAAGTIISRGQVNVEYPGIIPGPPKSPTGLSVLGNIATWYDHESTPAEIFFESADNMYFNNMIETPINWVGAPVLRTYIIQFPNRFYRVRTTGVYGTVYSNVEAQVNPPAKVTVGTSAYYVVLDDAGADLIMFLNAGVDYQWTIQSVIAGPFPDYVSALNAQSKINI